MLSLNELKYVANCVTYRPGWVLQVWRPDIIQGPYLSIYATVDNAEVPGETVDLKIHSPISPMADEGMFIEWLLWRLSMVELHECLEYFKVGGKCYINPHDSLD